MKQTIIGVPLSQYEKMLRYRTGLCILVAAGTIGLNILFTALRTDSNHTIMLILNIVSDILCGLFLLPFVSLRILPQRKLLKLMRREKEVIRVTVHQVSPTSQRYMDIDCHVVTGENRRFFLPVGTIALQEQAEYSLSLVQNIIVEATK